MTNEAQDLAVHFRADWPPPTRDDLGTLHVAGYTGSVSDQDDAIREYGDKRPEKD
jgi:hypothetical protein